MYIKFYWLVPQLCSLFWSGGMPVLLAWPFFLLGDADAQLSGPLNDIIIFVVTNLSL
jgi:hypothetical protein